ncbi:MAG: pyridine nucleotide-disulfide oxidoreductase [Candidatus Moraniibacteriota bacterium]|nr:MAG: pyridine nucleotide-disulfide oxidoreductase [Candidatus Moranbacteria bacterium]
MYETIIIGGGPAAVAAGVYAARKQIKTAFFATQIGGQSVVSDGIENWIGESMISGPDLAIKLKKHLEAQGENIDLFIGKNVDRVEKKEDETFMVFSGEDAYQTKTIIVCSGGRHRRLGVPGEAEFEGKGVAFCATCDAPFFKDKDVAVVGGGNSGLEAIVDLMAYAKKIYLIARRDELRGDSVTQKKIKASDQVEIIYNSEVSKVIGNVMVEGLEYTNVKSGEKNEISVQGIFVEIGSVPNSEIVSDIVETDEWNNIIVNFADQTTSCPGVFAAGDVTNSPYRQNNIAAGDAIKALLSTHEYLKKNS